MTDTGTVLGLATRRRQLGAIHRSAGAVQISYHGDALYYFAGDHKSRGHHRRRTEPVRRRLGGISSGNKIDGGG